MQHYKGMICFFEPISITGKTLHKNSETESVAQEWCIDNKNNDSRETTV